MNLKLKKISTKSFILIFSTMNVIAGLILGAVVTIVALVAPDQQTPGGVGAWAILIFPILNGILGVITGAFLTGMYNFLTKYFSGIDLEFEDIQ